MEPVERLWSELEGVRRPVPSIRHIQSVIGIVACLQVIVNAVDVRLDVWWSSLRWISCGDDHYESGLKLKVISLAVNQKKRRLSRGHMRNLFRNLNNLWC